MPLRFEAAKLLGPRYSLRCLLFHDVADHISDFTNGINVTLNTKDFESAMKFVSRHYTAIGLRDYLEHRRRGSLPERPAMVTFDDAYASVATNAAPILRRYGIPAVFFVNSSLVGNEEFGLDNLICYVANTCGLPALLSVARCFGSAENQDVASLEQVFDDVLPALSQDSIRTFRTELCTAAGISSKDLSRDAKLYVNPEQLHALAASGFEIGNHTYSHVFCRSLVGNDFEIEIDGNKNKLEAITSAKVQGFSVPYGSPIDMTAELAESLRRSGHDVAFLARDRSNAKDADLYRLNRINITTGIEKDLFGEIEVLPRLRSLADTLIGRKKPETLALQSSGIS